MSEAPIPLLERLERRRTAPLGVIDVHAVQRRHDRLALWVERRFPLLDRLLARQGGEAGSHTANGAPVPVDPLGPAVRGLGAAVTSSTHEATAGNDGPMGPAPPAPPGGADAARGAAMLRVRRGGAPLPAGASPLPAVGTRPAGSQPSATGDGSRSPASAPTAVGTAAAALRTAAAASGRPGIASTGGAAAGGAGEVAPPIVARGATRGAPTAAARPLAPTAAARTLAPAAAARTLAPAATPSFGSDPVLLARSLLPAAPPAPPPSRFAAAVPAGSPGAFKDSFPSVATGPEPALASAPVAASAPPRAARPLPPRAALVPSLGSVAVSMPSRALGSERDDFEAGTRRGFVDLVTTRRSATSAPRLAGAPHAASPDPLSLHLDASAPQRAPDAAMPALPPVAPAGSDASAEGRAPVQLAPRDWQRLVERVSRAVFRRLELEFERRGGSRWR